MRRSGLLALALILGLGCATSGPVQQEIVPREDRYFLVAPVTGYQRSLGPTTRRLLDEAHDELLSVGDRQRAQQVAADLLERNPDLAPAVVLDAQAAFVARDHDKVLTSLGPIVEQQPDYVAAQLLFGRSSEKVGNLLEALAAYESVASESELARSRVVELTPRSAEILALRAEDALTRGHTGEAQELLEKLRQIAPEEDRTLEVAIGVAEAIGDDQAELQALRVLHGRRPEDRALEMRRAELELDIGDPATGMRLFEDLSERYPEDPVMAEKLVEARFWWRFQLLPPDVRGLAEKPELTRGDFAVLVYWLFPEIRYGSVGGARIANDILDHPDREQIVRVVNARVLDVDPSLHRFEPYEAIRRQQALGAMLRLLARKEPPFACLASGAAPVSSQAICRDSAACGLLADEADCFSSAPVSGEESLQFFRQTQELLGVR